MPKIMYMSVNKAVENLILIKSLNPLGTHIFNKLWGVLTVILYYFGLCVVEVIYRAIK